jgi:hypothetical protein
MEQKDVQSWLESLRSYIGQYGCVADSIVRWRGFHYISSGTGDCNSLEPCAMLHDATRVSCSAYGDDS